MFLTRQIVAIHSDVYLFKQCAVFQQLILIKNRRYWRIDNNLPTGHLRQSTTTIHLSSVMDLELMPNYYDQQKS